MSKFLIYSTVFTNEKYFNLLDLLLKTYIEFGKSENNVDYLVISNTIYEKKILNLFEKYNIKGNIWLIPDNSFVTALCSRLFIFDYENINNYNKILYLDTDILITNKLDNIFNFDMENILYVLKEGTTDGLYWGRELFGDNNPKVSAFTSGILLFNNDESIKKLFTDIIKHIKYNINNKLILPHCIDQAFIVYQCVTKKMYNNEKLIGMVINNPKKLEKQIISHFPGGVGDYESKIDKMTNFYNNILSNKNSD
jgi:lipopolysaccharide biosynthesis glycosyltransferase